MILWLATLASAATLSGTVTDAEGEPVAGVFIASYNAVFRQVGVDGPTGPDGRYTVEAPAGRVRLRIVPGNSVDLVEAWFPGETTDVCAATAFTVSDDDAVTGLDVALQDGLSATGVVLDAAGDPLPGAEVEARPPVGSSAGIQTRRAITDAEGRFEVLGLPPDRGWALRVTTDTHPRQFVGGGYDALFATLVQGEAGERVDLGRSQLLPGITVSGTVFGPDGALPVADVSAFSEGQVRTVRAAADGTYTVRGLPPGDVTAWVDAPGHARVYWPDSTTPGDRVSVPEEGGVLEDFDLDAPFEAIVEGRLIGDGDLSGINALLVHESGTVGLGAVTDADGAFRIVEVPPGEWLLNVRADEQGFESGDVGLLGGGDTARTWTITEGQTVSIEADLVPAVTFEGFIYGADGEPAVDAKVTLRSRTTNERLETYVFEDGSYVIGGLPGGDTWELWAEGDPPCESDPDRVRIYAPGSPDWMDRLGYAMDAGDSLSWDATLPDDRDRDAMDDAWEQENGLDPTVPDGDEDPDGDGVENRIEYLDGTDPLAPPGGGCGCAASGGTTGAWGLALLALVGLVRRRSGCRG